VTVTDIDPRDTAPGIETPDYLQSATMAALDAVMKSPEARAVGEAVARAVELWEAGQPHPDGRRRRRRRHDLRDSLVVAAGALVADLVRQTNPKGHPGWVWRQLGNNTFKDALFGAELFRALVSGMAGAGLIHVEPGENYFRKYDFGGGAVRTTNSGRATRIRATAALLEMVKAHGIAVVATRPHFRRPPPISNLTLKGTTEWRRGRRSEGVPMRVNDDDTTQALRSRVHRINVFMDTVEIAGANVDGLHRGFNMGDHPAFAWNKGGRLYAHGRSSYQQIKAASRLDILLNGEPVREIDIRASFLTVLHGRTGTDFIPGPDPYQVEGVERSFIKSWVTASIGAGKPLARWPDRIVEDYAEDRSIDLEEVAPVARVAEAACSKYPLLHELERVGLSWADLMFTESEAIMATMEGLMEQGIPSLPVHDSLVVPWRSTEATERLLIRHYQRLARVTPLLKRSSGDWDT
jgi:hypothetical protein